MQGRLDAAEWNRLALRAHALLAEVPLHDVWAVDLAGGGPGRTVEDVRALLSVDAIAAANPAVRALFALRSALGRVFGWDREPADAAAESFVHRLSTEERARSRVPPGTPDGPFRVLFVGDDEAISEIRNPTVHAFSVLALAEQGAGYRLCWGIYVLPVGRITKWYMRLIDPFRHWVVYPALMRHLRGAWERSVSAEAAGRAEGDV